MISYFEVKQIYIVKYTISGALQEYSLTVVRPSLKWLGDKKNPAGFEPSSVISK